jgi:hypothetical protein
MKLLPSRSSHFRSLNSSDEFVVSSAYALAVAMTAQLPADRTFDAILANASAPASTTPDPANVAVVVGGMLSVDPLMSAPVSELSVATLLPTDPVRKPPVPSEKLLMSVLVRELSVTTLLSADPVRKSPFPSEKF